MIYVPLRNQIHQFRVLKIFYFLISDIAFNYLWNKLLEYDEVINNSVAIE